MAPPLKVASKSGGVWGDASNLRPLAKAFGDEWVTTSQEIGRYVDPKGGKQQEPVVDLVKSRGDPWWPRGGPWSQTAGFCWEGAERRAGRPLVRTSDDQTAVFVLGTSHEAKHVERAASKQRSHVHGGRGDWQKCKTEASKLGPQPADDAAEAQRSTRAGDALQTARSVFPAYSEAHSLGVIDVTRGKPLVSRGIGISDSRDPGVARESEIVSSIVRRYQEQQRPGTEMSAAQYRLLRPEVRTAAAQELAEVWQSRSRHPWATRRGHALQPRPAAGEGGAEEGGSWADVRAPVKTRRGVYGKMNMKDWEPLCEGRAWRLPKEGQTFDTLYPPPKQPEPAASDAAHVPKGGAKGPHLAVERAQQRTPRAPMSARASRGKDEWKVPPQGAPMSARGVERSRDAALAGRPPLSARGGERERGGGAGGGVSARAPRDELEKDKALLRFLLSARVSRAIESRGL